MKAERKAAPIPADLERCQAVIKTNSPFLMGGKLETAVRCSNEPLFVMQETKPAPDGLMGEMAVCDVGIAEAVDVVDMKNIAFQVLYDDGVVEDGDGE